MTERAGPSSSAAPAGSRTRRWGEVEVRVVPENDFGVLEHDVTLPDGTVVSNPPRVLPLGRGATVSVTRWTSAGFHAEVRAWVAERLAAHGLALTGEASQPHARNWSSATRFPTSGGTVWFKVNGPGTPGPRCAAPSLAAGARRRLTSD